MQASTPPRWWGQGGVGGLLAERGDDKCPSRNVGQNQNQNPGSAVVDNISGKPNDGNRAPRRSVSPAAITSADRAVTQR
jgi:hypothetical protein